jgi:putative DNA primase/helicase
VNEADDDPHRLARLFAMAYQTPDGLTLRYWQGEWYVWKCGAYRRLPPEELRAKLTARIKREFDRLNIRALNAWTEAGGKNAEGQETNPPEARKVTQRLVSDSTQAMAGVCLLPSSVQPPAWMPADDGQEEPVVPASDILVCQNGLGDLPALAGGERRLLPPSCRFFSLTALDYDFEPDAPAPTHWHAFLSQLWPNDQQAIDTLQEWFGYCLTGDTSQQKILMLVGPKRSGKGTVARILRALVATENTANPTLAGLSTNFGLWPLLGKTVAVISDARLSGRTDAAIVTERLLSVSGEDAQTIDRKNLPHITTTLPVRFAILTNELPRLSDASGALVSRLIVLRLTQSWYGREDTRLTNRLREELPGILLWAIAGWRRLHERGHFNQPSSARKLIRELDDLSSPIAAFLREHCILAPGCEEAIDAIYEQWKTWCDDKGRQPGTEQSFGRDLWAALPSLDTRQCRTEHGRIRFYVGLRLRRLGESPASDEIDEPPAP